MHVIQLRFFYLTQNKTGRFGDAFSSQSLDAVLKKLPYVLAYKSKNWDSFAPSKSGVDLYAGHSRSAYVPLSSGLKDASPRSATIGPHGSLTRHVGLHNLILQWNKRAGGRGVQCVLCCVIASRSPTWAWLACDWHHKWRIIVAVLDVGARRCVAPCCDQLLILTQNTRTFCTAASRGTLLMASATLLTRRHTRGWLIRGSSILDIFWPPRRRVNLYVDRRVHAYIR